MNTTTSGSLRWIPMDAWMNSVASGNSSSELVGRSSSKCSLVSAPTARPEKAPHTVFSRSPYRLDFTNGNFYQRQAGFRWTGAALHVTAWWQLTDKPSSGLHGSARNIGGSDSSKKKALLEIICAWKFQTVPNRSM